MRYSFTFSLFFLACGPLNAQNITFSIKSEMKKELMNKVNPTLNKNSSGMILAPSYAPGKAKQEDYLLEFYKKYQSGSGGEEFDDKYQIHPQAITYSSDVPINQINSGTVVPIFTGGHFVLVNPATNALGLIKPSGISLTGRGKKKLTAKTRQLLELLFDIKIDDSNQLE